VRLYLISICVAVLLAQTPPVLFLAFDRPCFRLSEVDSWKLETDTYCCLPSPPLSLVAKSRLHTMFDFVDLPPDSTIAPDDNAPQGFIFRPAAEVFPECYPKCSYAPPRGQFLPLLLPTPPPSTPSTLSLFPYSILFLCLALVTSLFLHNPLKTVSVRRNIYSVTVSSFLLFSDHRLPTFSFSDSYLPFWYL